nr:hypothetical protein [Saprospiraceae bacterium]
MNQLTILFKVILLVSAGFYFAHSTHAQSPVTKGQLVLEIIEVDMPGMADNPEAAMSMEMLKGSTTTHYFTSEKELVVINMMGGMMVNRTLTDLKTNRVVAYMDMAGQKIKVEMGDFEEVDEDVDIQTVVDKSDTRKILGYDCYKVVMTIHNQGMTMDIVTYVTEKLKMASSVVQGVQKNPLPGAILYMSVEGGGIKMITEAVEFNTSFDESVFEIDDKGYREMDMETLQRMGGMGF